MAAIRVAEIVRTRASRPLFGLAGQLLNAATNVATAFVASYLLTPDSFGRFVLAYACVTIVLATGRGLIGATLLAHLPRVDEPRRTTLTGSALGFTLGAGAIATVTLAALALAVPTLGWFVPWILVGLYQDAGRHVLLADGRSGSALVLDVAWAVAQAAVFAVVLVLGLPITIGVVAGAWGAGAVAGAVLYAARYGPRPRGPGPWTRTTRDVSGWFTGTAIVGQCEVYVVLLLVGVLLTPADAGGMRAVQLIALQPALVVLGSILILATPGFARLPADAPPSAVTRASVRVLLTVLPVTALIMLVVPLRSPLMALVLPQYQEYGSLVLPTALQAVTFAMAIPALALLRGRRYGRQVFGFQITRLGLVVAATLVALAGADVEGVAWVQVAASLSSLIAILVVARRVRGTALPTSGD